MANRYEMVVETDIDIPMRDGAILKANFFHPKAAGKFPVLMTFGPYGKDVPLKEMMSEAWVTLESMNHVDPDIAGGLAIWRPVADDPRDVIREGLPFLRERAREAGVDLG